MNFRATLARLIPFSRRIAIASKLFPRSLRGSLMQLAHAPAHQKEARHRGVQEVCNYQIRRVAHILDKSLSHPAWEPGHSGRVASELEALLGTALEKERGGDPTWRWARDILEEYRTAQREGRTRREDAYPDPARGEEVALVDRLLRSRRSIRRYRNEPVPEEVLLPVLEAINWCSTSCNRQPARVYAVRSPERVARVMKRFAGSTGFSPAIPCALVFCGDMRAYSMPMEMYLPALDVALGLQSCALAAHARGLSLTLMSWAQHSVDDEIGLRRDLKIPEWEQILVGGLLGYPAVTLSPPGRKALEHTAILLD